jgi:uncharacterized protein
MNTEILEPAPSMHDVDEWQPLQKEARGLFALVGGIWSGCVGLGLSIVAVIIASSKIDSWWLLAVAAVLMLALYISFGIWLGFNRWRYTTWKLDAEGLHVKRGRWWKSETLLPHSRVQHLDLERGPLERRRGLATLIIHTAGTRLQAVRLSGLLDAHAVSLRNALVPREKQDEEHDLVV